VLVQVLAFLLVFGLLCAVAARALLRIRPLGEGFIRMNDTRFVVWKLYTVLYEFGCGALKPFTVMFLRPVVQQLFGATIGKDVALGGKLVDPHMIRLADEAIIGEGSVVTAHAINSGSILLAPVIIEHGATVGVGAVIYPDVVIGERAIITANAVVRSGTRVPAGELWGGIPATCLRKANDA
jgi:acetyltransferase-like isoleucine patch superfamily enzyme